MQVTQAKFVQGFIRMATDGFLQGWHERNAGNLSYRMKEEEVASVKDSLDESGEWRDIGTEVPTMGNEYFLITGTGKYFRNVELDPEDSIGIIRVDESGTKYKILWGLVDGGRPTSELPSHLMNLAVCRNRDDNIRVVYHAHTANMIALTYVLPLDGEVITREIWEMVPECPIIFPNGIGVVPWMVPGGKEIALATSEIMKTQDVAVWAHHGMFVSGTDFDTTFGLMHMVEKAAEVLVKVRSMTDTKRQTLQPDEFRSLNEPFKIAVGEQFLYERKSNVIGEK